MIHHVLLFRPRANLTGDEQRALAEALGTALREIPGIRACHIGRRVRHGREYERLMVEDFSYAAVLEFDDLAHLKAYLEHPAHEALGVRFMSAVESALIYDYEMTADDENAPADEMRKLLE